MMFFRKYIMIFAGLFSMAISFLISIWMHPHVYRNGSSRFSRVRGGPAVGVAITLAAAFINLEIMNKKYNRLNTDSIIQSLASAFVFVGSGVMCADMLRTWTKAESNK